MLAADLPVVKIPSVGIKDSYLPPRMREQIVLIIDQDTRVIKFLTDYLSYSGCRILTAATLNEAISLCKNNKVDLVFSEFLLGDHSCLEITMLIRKLNPNLPIAIMSSYDDLISEKDVKNFSADFFLSKPFELSRLDFILKSCLLKGNICS